MCWFRLHFSDFNVLLFKKIKNLLQFTFEKNNLCKKREKNVPDPPPPHRYQMVRPLCFAGWTISTLVRGINEVDIKSS